MPFGQYAGEGGTSSKWGSSSASKKKKEVEPPYSTKSVDKQIDNAKLRIKDSNPVKKDKRNLVERSLNLPEGQNWLFDTFDVIGRPQQAFYGAVDAVYKGKDLKGIKKEAAAGFKGNQKLTGSDFIKPFGKLTEDKFGVNVSDKLGLNKNKYVKGGLGFAMDVVADPINLIPGGAIVKAAKLGTKPVVGSYKALEKALPAVENIRRGKVEPALQAVKDGLGKAFKYQYKWDETLKGGQSDVLKNSFNKTKIDIANMTEDSLRNIADAAKKAGGVKTGDSVSRVMEAPLRQFEDVQGYEFPDGLQRTENKGDLVQRIKANQGDLKSLGKETNKVNQQYKQAIQQFSSALSKTNDDIRKTFYKTEKNAEKGLNKDVKTNLRSATKEIKRIDSQINNFGTIENSLLRQTKRMMQEQHNSKFDLLKQIRQVSPNGIKGIDMNVPNSLKNHVRITGKAIDEVAEELGYKYADDLVQDIKSLNGTPRRLDNDTLTELALKEMDRTGAINDLNKTKEALLQTKETIGKSINELAGTNLAGKIADKAFADIAQNPKFVELDQQRKALTSQLDSLKNESSTVRRSKISEIKSVEDEIQALRESAANPVMMQKEFQRPTRDIPNAPKIVQAAKKLTESDNFIRQWATDNDIPVKEIEGYMRHILSKEELALRKQKTGKNIDRPMSGMNNPDKKILEARKNLGSAEDVNERFGRKFFEPNAFFSTAQGQKKLIDYSNAVKFRKEVLTNPDFAVKFKPGMNIGDNVVINTNNYKFIKEGAGDELEGLVDEIGGDYVVTKGAKEALDRYQKLTTDEGTRGLLKTFDTIQRTWKKLTLLSPGYHIRNIAGGNYNNFIAGMNPHDIAHYGSRSLTDVVNAVRGKPSKMYTEYRDQGLASSNLSRVEFNGENFEDSMRKLIKEQSRGKLGKVATRLNPLRLPETSRELGEFFDQSNRLSLYSWARAKGMTPEQAAAKVREVQFDYTRTTNAENEVLTRLVPFYRWMKNNIPYQLRSFINNPARYSAINKLRTNAQDTMGINEENTPQFMKEQLAIPTSEKKFLALNLPVGDLTKLSNPLKLASDSLTPLVKLPIELSSNFNLFKQKPIEKFEGQTKQYSLPGGKEFDIPIKTAYAIEQLGGQVGRGFSQYLQKDGSEDQDNKFRTPSLGISSVLKDYDVKKEQYFQKRRELQELQDELDYIEQQTGNRPRTVREINK